MDYDDREYTHILKHLITKKYTAEIVDWLQQLGDRKINLNFMMALAIATNNIQIVDILAKKINIRYRNNFYLYMASMMGYSEILELLIRYGIDIHSDDDYALIVAASNGHNKIVEILLKHGGIIDAQDNCAIKWAYMNNHMDTVELLQKNGASRNNIDVFCCKKNNTFVVTCELHTGSFRISRISYDKNGNTEKVYTQFDDISF